MSSQQSSQFSVDRYVVIHVATTCDEHGVYVTKDSAEVIELGWILVDANTLEEVSLPPELPSVWRLTMTIALSMSPSALARPAYLNYRKY